MTNEPKHDDQDVINRVFSRIDKLQDKVASNAERLLDKKIASDNESQKITNRLQSRTTIGGYLALAVTFSIGAAGIVADAYLKNQDRDDQTLRQAGQRKQEIIGEVSNAITRMRELKDLTVIACVEPMTKNEKIKHLQERAKRGFDLLQVTRPVAHFFNDRFWQLYGELLAWEESIPDYCDKNAPSDKEWRTRQKEIEDQMILAPIMSFAD